MFHYHNPIVFQLKNNKLNNNLNNHISTSMVLRTLLDQMTSLILILAKFNQCQPHNPTKTKTIFSVGILKHPKKLHLHLQLRIKTAGSLILINSKLNNNNNQVNSKTSNFNHNRTNL